jgi:hypothetical protein
MPLSEFKPLVRPSRTSTPPLKECLALAQLKESAMVQSVLVLPLVLLPGFRMLLEMLINMVLNSTG